MPGPRNQKKKKSPQNKKGPGKKGPVPQPEPVEQVEDASSNVTSSNTSSQQPAHADHRSSPAPLAPSPPPALSVTTDGASDKPTVLPHDRDDNGHTHEHSSYPEEHDIYPEVQYATYSPYSPYLEEPAGATSIPSSLLKPPFIHDPGSGPRVKDVHAFLESRLASPPSLDDPLCGEFADEAVLQMLCTVLPEETAMVRRDILSSAFMITPWSPDIVVQQEPDYGEDMPGMPEAIPTRRHPA